MPFELHAERRDAELVLTSSGEASNSLLSEPIFAAGIEAPEVSKTHDSVRPIVWRGDGEHVCAGAHPLKLDAEPEHLLENLFHANGAKGLQSYLDRRPAQFG